MLYVKSSEEESRKSFVVQIRDKKKEKNRRWKSQLWRGGVKREVSNAKKTRGWEIRRKDFPPWQLKTDPFT